MTVTDPAGGLQTLIARRRADGGFPEQPGGDYRPDATAWVIHCLAAYQLHGEIASAARARLKASQHADGSIPVTANHPEAFWPTFPGALAFSGVTEYREAHDRAIGFILGVVNKKLPHEESSLDFPKGLVPGWPWTNHTHTWVEPTAMAVRALTLAGRADHERTLSGIRLLIDRQLPDGGWNYGSTVVFDQYLNPMPVPTGMALWALSGHVERTKVAGSLRYLQGRLSGLVTPHSLGWALIGLSSWQVPVDNGHELAVDCLSRQQRYGAYNTTHLAILLYAMEQLRTQVPDNV